MPRSKILTHERFARPPAPDPAQRELTALREIVHTFLNADRPEEVFQFALDRVSPLIGASFASVYLVDGVSELMRLAAAFNWPAKYRPWLGETRIRLGFGPSGEAASERRMIEVPDVNTDKALEDWAEVAAELGFRSLVALPLEDAAGTLGAVTFYFSETGTPSPERRHLMRLVADQMAATAEKVNAVDNLRRTTAAFLEANAELERQYAAVRQARRVKDEFLANASDQLRTPVTTVITALERLQGAAGSTEPTLAGAHLAANQLLWRVDELLEYAALQAGGVPIDTDEFEPHEAIEGALRVVEFHSWNAHVRQAERGERSIRLRTDRRKTTRILASLLTTVMQWAPEDEVVIGYAADNDTVRYRVHSSAVVVPREARDALQEGYRTIEGITGGTGLGVALARQLARLLGGDLVVVSSADEGLTMTVELPCEWVAGSG
ncbi:MAG: GAF domain-containing protein [Gemmatimonadaceae bacterium]